jgi:citrate synthase
MTEQNSAFWDYLCKEARGVNQISPETFDIYEVRRGLRRPDGSGVMAGVTTIGAAHGYVIVDGERKPMPGRLIYRGIDIMDLIHGYYAEGRYGFPETTYLLLFGSLPSQERLAAFNALLHEYAALPPHFIEDMILKAPSQDIMNALSRSVLALYSFDQNPNDCSLPNMLRQGMELVARFPVIVASAYAVKKHYYDHGSLLLHHPPENLSPAEAFLYCLRPDNKYTEEEARLLDVCMVLHAEHGGGNSSTFSCRTVSSSGTDTYSAIAAAIGALKGPLHGGANNAVMSMFKDIQENVEDWTCEGQVADYLAKIIRKEAGNRSGLIYGMGHAVYTLSDPRVLLLKDYARTLSEKNGLSAEFELMDRVERLAPAVFTKVKGDKKVISANVDMYSGLVYQMLGIPQELYTPLFAIARIAGWVAHRIEEVLTGGRIIRPAYKAIGPDVSYVPLAERD